jgi:hypothetical protein
MAEDGGKVAITSLVWTRDGVFFITGDDQGSIYYFEWTMTKMNKAICPAPGMGINSVNIN